MNYFNTLPLRLQLGRAREVSLHGFIRSSRGGVEKLKGKKVVILGCGAQGPESGAEHA